MTLLSSERPASAPASTPSPRTRLSRRRHRSLVLLGALLFFFTPALAFVGGVRAQPIENRPLAAFPAVTAGWGFFSGFDRWAVDHLTMRDLAVRANSATSERLFAEAPDYGSRPAEISPVGPAPVAPAPLVAAPGVRPPAVPKTAAAGKPAGPGDDPEQEQVSSRRSGIRYPSVVEGRDRWLYSGKDFAFACEPQMELDAIFAGYRRLISILETSGRRVVITVAPDKSTVVPDHLPETYLGKKCSTQRKAELWDRLDRGDLGPQYLDMRRVLEHRQAADGKPVYFRSDSHWTSVGRVLFAREALNRLSPGLYRDSDLVDIGTRTRSGDLGRQLGDRREDTLDFWELHPPGVTSRETAVEESRWKVAHYRATGPPGARLFAPPTVLMGDSFSVESIGAFRPYFADLTFAHRELWPAKRIPVLRDARVVVVEVVERVFTGDSTSSRGASLLDKDFLDQLERQLPPVAAAGRP